MSLSVSATRAADPPVRRQEILSVALLLAFAGGYIDTYTRITHGVLANAQTANLVFLMGVCAAFGTAAAAGAFLTERIPTLTSGIPAVALLMVLLLFEPPLAAEASRE